MANTGEGAAFRSEIEAGEARNRVRMTSWRVPRRAHNEAAMPADRGSPMDRGGLPRGVEEQVCRQRSVSRLSQLNTSTGMDWDEN